MQPQSPRGTGFAHNRGDATGLVAVLASPPLPRTGRWQIATNSALNWWAIIG